MEDGLRGMLAEHYGNVMLVLILVLMEDGLRGLVVITERYFKNMS